MAKELQLGAMEGTQIRAIMGSFPSGVAVVTAVDVEGQPRGFTAIAFCSVSLEPPLCLICADKHSTTLSAIQHSRQFVVNFLRDDQCDVSARFASKATDKFIGLKWLPGPVSAQPVLEGIIAYAECSVWQEIDAGDHWIFIGHVEAGATDVDASPLVYFRREYRSWELLSNRHANDDLHGAGFICDSQSPSRNGMTRA